MATQLLSIGYPQAIAQNTAYAMPKRRVLLFSDTPAATIIQSTDAAFTASAPLALAANGQAEVAGDFIKCTSGAINVTLKAMS